MVLVGQRHGATVVVLLSNLKIGFYRYKLAIRQLYVLSNRKCNYLSNTKLLYLYRTGIQTSVYILKFDVDCTQKLTLWFPYIQLP